MKEIMAQGGAEPDRTRKLARSLTAVGEALFFFAEQNRSASWAVVPAPVTKSEGSE